MSDPSKVLAEQLQWALDHYLFAIGVNASQPPMEPPQSTESIAKKG